MQQTDGSDHKLWLGRAACAPYVQRPLDRLRSRGARMSSISPAITLRTWRTPAVVVLAGCLIAMITFGPRSALGQFLSPLSLSHGWGRDIFSFALAIQNLLWGVGQPFAGAVADRFGATRVISAGAILYAMGLAMMAYAQTPETIVLSSGVLIGFGLSGCSFNLVI